MVKVLQIIIIYVALYLGEVYPGTQFIYNTYSGNDAAGMFTRVKVWVTICSVITPLIFYFFSRKQLQSRFQKIVLIMLMVLFTLPNLLLALAFANPGMF